MATTIQYPTSPAPPALPIPASDDDLRMIGELCQGQIELLMLLTTTVLRGTTLKRARKRLSSPNFQANAEKWLQDIKKNVPQQNIKELAEAIVGQIGVIKLGRNDYVHAFFAFEEGGDGFTVPFTRQKLTDLTQIGTKPTVIAVHNLKKISMSNLKDTRNRAAAISWFVLHIYEHCAAAAGFGRGVPAPPGAGRKR